MKCKSCGMENKCVEFCINCNTKLEEELLDTDLDVSIEDKKEENNNFEIPNLKNDKSKKKTKYIVIGTSSIVLLVVGYLLYEFLFPRISVTNMKDDYEYKDFLKNKYTIKKSLFISSNDAIWNINGYDFYKGKEPKSIPVQSGENKLVVSTDKASKTYTFTITTEDTLLITDEETIIDAKYLDYDGDGIPNEKEVELGLATYTNDTDGDGLYDNVELIMGLDPKVKDDYNTVRSYDVVQDNKENYENYVTVKGKGNIANNFLDTTDLNVGYSSNFISSDVLTLVTSEEEKPKEKKIYFKKRYNWKLEDYAIYDYNKINSELTELDTKENDDYFYADIEFNHLLFVGKRANAPLGEYKNQIMILIDNSGSMYSREYVAEKTGREISEEDDSDYGNDIEFKRLSLMNSLVDRLGTDKYTYSVNAFTGSHCSLVEQSQDNKTIKSSINSLKEECQNFNGTDLSGAIRSYSGKFDEDTPGVKFMLVLTDGVDAGFLTYELYDYNLSNYKKKGIKIITIGLGNGVNSEYLQKIAVGTDGTYLYASDANMLETLISIIENSITNQYTTTIDDKEVTLIADSGFEVNRDGFSFGNFGSEDSPAGNCYGFSYLSKLIYLNKLPTSASYEKGGMLAPDSELIAYTLTDTNINRLKKGNIYNLKIADDYEYFLNLSDLPDDYRYLGDDGIPYLNDKYKKRMISLGFKPTIKEVKDKVEIEINGTSATYSKYESMGSLNLVEANIDEKYKDDYQVLQLINRNYRVQKHHLFDLIGAKIEKDLQGDTYDYEKEVKQIVSELKTGSPTLLSITCSLGNHSVLATKVYKSNDLEEYVVGIYDSNTPGVEGQAYLKRQTSYFLFAETSYYSFSYNGAGIEFNKMIYSGEY